MTGRRAVTGISRTLRASGYLGLATAMMILAGCASAAPGQATGRHAAPATAQDAVSPSPSSSAIPSWRLKALASKYLAVARPANERLDRANDGFEDEQRDNLGAAAAGLRSEAVTEHWFDQHVS